ncbi:hypothetical protein Hdeb2414_s0259g00850631 [Helianthus debilis subsp. tardiflorus]
MGTGRRGTGVVCRASPNQDGVGDGPIPSSLTREYTSINNTMEDIRTLINVWEMKER